MQKNLLLVLLAAVAIPGCTKQKDKKNKGKRKSDTYASIDIPLAQDVDVDDILEQPTVLSFFEDDEDDDLDDMPTIEEIEFVMSDEQEPVFVEEPVQQLVWQEEEKEEEFKSIYFDFDGYDVRQDQEDALVHDLTRIKETLDDDENPATVIIEGHACHSAGSPAYNVALSEKRAKVIADTLASKGVDTEHVKVVAYGQERPAVVDGKVVTGSREEQWKNRRVEVKVING
jgi:outer membrane protein OmpA-like peptidoglycan-associated protein